MTYDSADAHNLLITDDAGGGSDAEGHRRRQKLLSLLRGRYHWAIIAALVLGTAGALTGYFYQADMYESQGRLEIRPQMPNIDGRNHVMPMWNEFVNTRLSALKTSRVVDAAMASDVWRQAAAKAGVEMSTQQFANSIYYDRIPQSNLVDVRFETTEPTLAVAGLDAVLTAYMQVFTDIESQSDAAVLRALNDRRAKLTSDIQRWTYQRQQVGGEAGSETLEPRFNYALKETLTLESEINAIDRALGGKGTADGENNAVDSGLAEMSTSELISLDGTLNAYHLQRQEAERHIEALKLQGFSDNHRAVQQSRSALTILEQQVAQRVQMLRSGQVLPDGAVMGPGTGDRDQLRAHKRNLERQLDESRRRTEELGDRLRRVQTIESQIADARVELQNIQAQTDRMDMEKLLSGRLALVASGVVPTEPSNGDRRIKMAGVSGVGGAGLGVALILLIGLLDPRLRHIEDAELDLPTARMLGTLPTLPADLVDPEQAVLVAHSVHHIRTLLQIGRDPQGNVFSITSPAPGSGKTSLTMALGLSFASSGAKTLLIDADIVGGGLTRRMGFVVHPRVGQVLLQNDIITEPQINEALRVAQSTGVKFGQALLDLGYVTAEDLEDALESQRDDSIGLLEACGAHRFEECVAPTGIQNLYVLPIGTALPQQAGALSPAAIRRVIQQARSQFDTVLIDTGPLLGSLEAAMAASEATGTVFIVSRGDQKPLVAKCVDQLHRIGGRLAGVVFNHALANDIARSTYGSVTMSQSRHPNNHANVEPIDADTSARFGPLATAVASYAAGGGSSSRSGRRQNRATSDGPRHTATHPNGTTNGNHNGTNGHSH